MLGLFLNYFLCIDLGDWTPQDETPEDIWISHSDLLNLLNHEILRDEQSISFFKFAFCDKKKASKEKEHSDLQNPRD